MEGISHEALSLAGHLKLKTLFYYLIIILFQLMVPTNLAVSDDHEKDLRATVGTT